MDRVPITPTGHDRLQKELTKLKKVDRPEVIDAIATAREHGDLKENAEYHAAREKQGMIEARIDKLESIFSRAQVIDPTDFDDNTVRFGATVELADVDTDEEIEYRIVGEYEADIDKGRLSVSAPLSRAIIGKQPGDVVKVRTPRGPREYEILEVSYDPLEMEDIDVPEEVTE
jgi:transcription elongation factor GreA